MMFRIENHTLGTLKRLYINEEFVGVFQNIEQLEKIKTLTKPMICSANCGYAIEYTEKGTAFVQDKGNYGIFYCGCKGWD
jgi:hypothetical protein